ncbi:hypothetical protein EMIHUDRAFT_453884, partial [Emiliania huxleyi CCMP1516]|uniref:Uncharacterized protein n=2 Tax=Emiliania huxleyi TaxID=2903 RepID=A0A0D3HZD6_EMIH1
ARQGCAGACGRGWFRGGGQGEAQGQEEGGGRPVVARLLGGVVPHHAGRNRLSRVATGRPGLATVGAPPLALPAPSSFPPAAGQYAAGGEGGGGAAGGAGPRRRRRGGGATWLAASPGLRSTRARRQGAVGGPGGVGVRPTSPPPSFPPVCCALLKKDRSGAVSVRRRSLVCFVGSGGLFCSEREKNT